MAAMLSTAPASASLIDFTFSTEGCFVASGSCTPLSSDKANPNFNFTGVTNSTVSTATSIPLTDLGVFEISPGQKDAGAYSGVFDLAITFTAPTGVSPNPGTFTATYSASVTNGKGGQTGTGAVDFNNAPQTFSFNGGTFTVSVNDVQLSAIKTDVELTGLLTLTSSITSSPPPVTAVPEPSTWAMMIIGFLGLGWLARRRARGVVKFA